MRELIEQIDRVSPIPVPVLIRGETGVGKELVARLIHARSGRGDRPFIPVNISTLRGGLFESSLFGHLKGAFTGAVSRHAGLAVASDSGTLFLDEIGEAEAGVQARLLRFLDSGEFIPVGGERPMRSSARILAATNRDLEADVSGGAFRMDLYYRLSAVQIRIPPLRERKEDIVPLARHFLSSLTEKYRVGPLSFSEDAERMLYQYSWPGNVRQLRNEISAAVLRKRSGVIEPTDMSRNLLDAFLDQPEYCCAGLDGRMRMYERSEILEALRVAGSNRSRAASILGLKRTTLLYRMKRHGIALREKKRE
jgi:DNA-binding NtrC family response regulator